MPMDFRSFEDDQPTPPLQPAQEQPPLPGGDSDREKIGRALTAAAWELRAEAGRLRSTVGTASPFPAAANVLATLSGLATVGARLALREDLADLWD